MSFRRIYGVGMARGKNAAVCRRAATQTKNAMVMNGSIGLYLTHEK